MTQYSLYCGDLVSSCRRDTQNAADIPTSTSQRGIQTKDIIRYLNYAQQSLERQITSLYPFVFQGVQTFNVTAGQSTYTISDNMYLGMRIKKVEFSYDGQTANYVELPKMSDENVDYYQGTPLRWHREDYAIVLEPIPNTTRGTLKITYQRTLDTMAIRAGQITAITVSGAGNVTAITVNPATDDEQAITEGLTSVVPLCISTSTGIVRAYNIPYTAFNTGTGVFTITPTAIVDATTPPAVGDWVTVGRYTTTHSKLPLQCEEYLVEFTSRKLKIRESSPTDWQALDMMAQRMAKEIAAAYAVKDTTAKQAIPVSGFGANMLTVQARRYGYRF